MTFRIPTPFFKSLLGIGLVAAAIAGMSGKAEAALAISKGATKNVTCSAGICTAIAKNAVLNVNHLQNLLADSDVTVTTRTNSDNIEVAAAMAWANSNSLTLIASHSIIVDDPISITGRGGLGLTTNYGSNGDASSSSPTGTITYGANGQIIFSRTSNKLTINGLLFTLVNKLGTLASDIAANPNGNFALSFSIDAKYAGTYPKAPISGMFFGTFDGLGNTISNLTIVDHGTKMTAGSDGLFAVLGRSHGFGTIRDFALVNASVTNTSKMSQANVGTLVGLNAGVIQKSWATGAANCNYFCNVGGLVGFNASGKTHGKASTISLSAANVLVSGGNASCVGGLVGRNEALISQSFAVGAVSTGHKGAVGGLEGCAGVVASVISQSYATGAVSCTSKDCQMAGFGSSVGKISQSFATGMLSLANQTCGGNPCAYGFCGCGSPGIDSFDYWDMSTTGITDQNLGVGDGITGLTSTELQSGLPPGFDPAVWVEHAPINGGFPYLLANPP